MEVHRNAPTEHVRRLRLCAVYIPQRSKPEEYAESIVEIEGSTLRIIRTILLLAQQQYFYVKTDDPNYLSRTADYSKTRDAAGVIALGVVFDVTNSRPQFSTIAARSKLLDYCSETVPDIAALQIAQRRKEIIDELDTWADTKNPDVLQPKIAKLRDQVAAGTNGGGR